MSYVMRLSLPAAGHRRGDPKEYIFHEMDEKDACAHGENGIPMCTRELCFLHIFRDHSISVLRSLRGRMHASCSSAQRGRLIYQGHFEIRRTRRILVLRGPGATVCGGFNANGTLLVKTFRVSPSGAGPASFFFFFKFFASGAGARKRLADL